MPSRKTPQTVDDDREPDSGDAPVFERVIVKAYDYDMLPQELQNLIESDIATHDSGVVTWRTGHLEHVANLYASDPVQTERDYHDDVTVAKAYSAEEWSRLLEAAKA